MKTLIVILVIAILTFSSVVFAAPMAFDESLLKRQVSCEKTPSGDEICTQGQPKCDERGCVGLK
ncbi:17186_t:CDS:2 [Funneliformis caledonium]|uniref:17186_t:CDS:1 n=1 Tax=Funneliformis caledonium TaxID=1117310 RepID=A0A9N9EZQ4_9GLOM|nr:17186_t:CDS:2 [Funneliformis caledonium]